jgi:hypothetical protein
LGFFLDLGNPFPLKRLMAPRASEIAALLFLRAGLFERPGVDEAFEERLPPGAFTPLPGDRRLAPGEAAFFRITLPK